MEQNYYPKFINLFYQKCIFMIFHAYNVNILFNATSVVLNDLPFLKILLSLW